eukprot:CAMPEP_0183352824 /NCGR_PEP_ID=MMETSP0164_2-20130417/30766_1 /TAXON_ID=221442 /ORGANISM="Coccolithus pelagicus ssp braarudi, Strain PLY182g" /LENGTH=153 /DNA_ID=CAMNT_0025525367 /DNA_START=100 /DNA_END=561 /DNA_ORIENTATION=+
MELWCVRDRRRASLSRAPCDQDTPMGRGYPVCPFALATPIYAPSHPTSSNEHFSYALTDGAHVGDGKRLHKSGMRMHIWYTDAIARRTEARDSRGWPPPSGSCRIVGAQSGAPRARPHTPRCTHAAHLPAAATDVPDRGDPAGRISRETAPLL